MFDNGIIRPDPMSVKPIELWKKYLRQGRVSEPIKTLRVNAPICENKVRFVCISDTHGKLDEIVNEIPDGDVKFFHLTQRKLLATAILMNVTWSDDSIIFEARGRNTFMQTVLSVLIHAGDFTNYGDVAEVINFNAAIGTLPHKVKLVIAGNHELGFEDGEELTVQQLNGLNMLGINKAYELLTNCIYLCDRQIDVFGLKIYGTPWHPMPGYSFYRARGAALLKKWEMIPNKLDVLITHTPPLGHGDYNAWNKCDGVLAGCAELLNTVEYRVKPKYHVFGHIHDRHGATTNGKTKFINASTCDHKLNCVYPPIIFDLPLPMGRTKEDYINGL